MLRVRVEQVKVFEQAALQAFEDEMVLYLGDFTPKLAKIAGEEGLRQTARSGIERARGFGLTKRGAVRSFLEMKVWFGCDFDTDPLLPWAREVLTDEEIDDQVVRAMRLH